MKFKLEQVPGYDWTLVLRSVVVAVACYFGLVALGERDLPPVGHVFERLPPLKGIYRCCGNWASWAGGEYFSCSLPNYFPFASSRGSSCGLRELEDKVVEVGRVNLPGFNGPNSAVFSIASGGKVYYSRSDEELRRLWHSGVQSGASFWAFQALLLTQGILYLLNIRSLKARR